MGVVLLPHARQVSCRSIKLSVAVAVDLDDVPVVVGAKVVPAAVDPEEVPAVDVVTPVLVEPEVVSAVDVDAGAVVNGTDVANLEAGIACWLTGYRPVARKPDLICAGLKEASHSFFSNPIVG